MTDFVTTAEAREHFSDVLNRAAFGKERVVLTRRGKPLVAVVPIEDVEALEALEDMRDSHEIRTRLDEFQHATGEDALPIPLEEVARRLGLTRRKSGT
jgi:prevent-host-death family protein